MTLQIPSPNAVLLPANDKLGRFIIELRDTLVGSGLWRVTGSSDGATFQNEGQTAGLGGAKPWDVLINPAPYTATVVGTTWYVGGTAGSISNRNAWLQLREVGSTRVMQLQRDSAAWSGGLRWRFCPSGVATSGATVGVLPAPVGASYGGALYEHFPGVGGDPNNGIKFIYQLWVATEARAGGVCPFAFTVHNANSGANINSGFYESLVDIDPSNPHPYLFYTGASWNVMGGAGTQSGPFWNQYGCTGVACDTFRFDQVAINGGLMPGTTYEPLAFDGKWRTSACLARKATGARIGRSEHFLMNRQNREYPATYDLGSTTPRIAVGHFLLPWKTNVVPSVGP